MFNIPYLNKLIAKQKIKDKENFEIVVNKFSEIGINLYVDESKSEIKSVDIILKELSKKWAEN